jgi:hypothetical protein
MENGTLRTLRPHEVDVPRLFGADTAPAVERWLIEAYRRMPPEAKLAKVQALSALTTTLALADIRQRHPHASQDELHLRLACRRYGPEFVRRTLGWDVEREGW